MPDENRTAAVILLMMIVGMIFAMIEYWMNSRSLFIPEILTGSITLGVLMFGTVFSFTLFGVIIAASQ